jgi:hypothetical protein
MGLTNRGRFPTAVDVCTCYDTWLVVQLACACSELVLRFATVRAMQHMPFRAQPRLPFWRGESGVHVWRYEVQPVLCMSCVLLAVNLGV